MIDPPVKVGVIGCGAQGKNHLNVIKELGTETAVVSALCDLSPERLQNAKEVWPRAQATNDFEEMLAPGELDLVIVATMPNTHMQMALAALEAGADVLCEKPFMRNLGEAETVLDTAERLGRQVQLGTNMRYMATSRYLHNLVASGEGGAPVFSKVWGCHVNPPWWGPHYYLSQQLCRRCPCLHADTCTGSCYLGRGFSESSLGKRINAPPVSRKTRSTGFTRDKGTLQC